MTIAYLSTKLEVGNDVETLIWNGKFFEPAWQVRPNLLAKKAMLQAEYETRTNRVENLRINLSTAYSLVLGKCTDYLRSGLEKQKKWETMLNKQDLLGPLKSVKSLSHKYDKDTKYHHVAYHMLLRCFILFWKGDYSN